MKYYELKFDWGYEGGWTLDGLQNYGEDEWIFVRGGKIQDSFPSLSVEILLNPKEEEEDYIPLDLTFIPSIQALVGSKKALLLFEGNEVQAIPVTIRNSKQLKHYIFSLLNLYDCVDYNRSDIEYWEKGNKIRPDLTGKIRTFNKLYINPEKVGDARIFRLYDKYTTVIVREDLMNQIKKQLNADLKFELVV